MKAPRGRVSLFPDFDRVVALVACIAAAVTSTSSASTSASISTSTRRRRRRISPRRVIVFRDHPPWTCDPRRVYCSAECARRPGCWCSGWAPVLGFRFVGGVRPVLVHARPYKRPRRSGASSSGSTS